MSFIIVSSRLIDKGSILSAITFAAKGYKQLYRKKKNRYK